MISRLFIAVALVLFLAGTLTGPAFATVEQGKTYKTVFKQSSLPKCIVCHTAKTPLKTAGKHDLNEYGLKVKALLAPNADPKKPDGEAYRKVGPAS